MTQTFLRTVSIAAFAGALALAAPARAQDADLVAPAGAGSTILSIGSLDGPAIEHLAASIADRAAVDGADAGVRLKALQSALEDLTLIETVARRPTSPDPRTEAITATGKRALLSLAASGHDRDRLSRQAIAAEAEWIRTGALDAAAQTAAFVDLDRLSADVTDPAAKAEVLILIGHTHQALGNVDRAIRYGQLAERAARDVVAGEARDAVLADVLALATSGDPAKTLGIVSAALSGFADAGRRAAAISAVAARVAAPDAGAVVAAVEAGTTPIRDAVWPVLGAGDAAAAKRLQDAAVRRMEDEAAALIAASRADAVAQDAALAAIVAAQILQQRSFAALDTARLMLTAERQRHAATIARVLAEAGYDRVAKSVADEVIADGAAVPEAVAEARVALDLVARPDAPLASLADHAAALRALSAGGDERETAAGVLDTLPQSDLRAALEKIRALKDYRVRVAAFRAVTEWQAARLDVEGRIAARAVPPTGGETPVGAAPALMQTAGVRLVDGAAVRGDTPILVESVPDLSARADAVRRMVPVPLPGVSELSLAGLNRFTQLNRFNSKFLEDVVGTTAREHIFKTQGTINPTFLYLTNGVFTARDLLHAIDTSSGDQLVRDDGVYTLRVPLVIGPDATLVLSGQDAPEIRLSASAGAFIINAGKLFLVDASLVGWDEEKNAPALATYETKNAFRPFITTWSGSETYIAGSKVLGLGYSAGKSYGITISSGPKEGTRPDRLPRPKGLFVDSSFDNLLYGFYTYEADDVLVIGNEYKDNVVYGLDPHDRSKRLVMGYNTLYGTMEKHGAIFSRDVEHSHLIGNIAFDNAGSGIMMDRRSSLNWIYANTAIGNAQDGMTVYESPCVLIAANAFVGNGRSGIKIRNSWNVLVEGNHVADNSGPGIESYVADLSASEAGELRDLVEDPYLQIASMAARGNTVARNTVGITARGTSEVELSDNLFVDQTPGVFDGQLKPLRAHLLQYAGGGRPVTVRAADLAPRDPKLADEAGTPFCPPPGRIAAPAVKEGM